MRPVPDPVAALAWLGDDCEPTGSDHDVWPHSTWVLHAMYEHPGLPEDVTHDDVHRQQVAEGLVPRTIINGVDLDDKATILGIPLGYARRPDPPARRLRWADHLDLAAERPFPPGFGWFDRGSWPLRIAPPPEGSLDEVSLAALLRVLARHTQEPCFAFYAQCASRDFDRQTVLTGPVPSVAELPGRFEATPSNLWPADRSWFVWTDWDLMGTRVSGSAELIADLKADPDLETLDHTIG